MNVASIPSAPYHNAVKHAGSVSQWELAGLDNLDNWNFAIRQPDRRAMLDKNGWLSNPGFEYRYNQFGFRGNDFSTCPSGMAFGCSHTFGSGLPEQDTWVSQFSRLTNTSIWNLGVASAALDTVYRLVSFWVRYVRPEFILVLAPPSFRYEITYDNETWITENIHSCTTEFSKNYFLNYANSSNNYEKNLDAISSVCNHNGAQCYVLSADNDLPIDHAARDTVHSGATAMQAVAEKFANQYSVKGVYQPWK